MFMRTQVRTWAVVILAALLIEGGLLWIHSGVSFVRIVQTNPSSPVTSAATTTDTPTMPTTTTVAPQFASPDTSSVSPVLSASTSLPTVATLLRGMHMTFDDEFNSFSRYVDKSGNITCKNDGSGTWQTVYFFCSRTSAGNHEAEVYVDPGFLAYLKSENAAAAEQDPDNAFAASGGILSIRATTSTPQIVKAVGVWAKYTSGLITTQYSFSQKYGYFEARMKLPKGKGLWPAFWLLPVDKTWPPEVDAMEAFGDPNDRNEGGRTMIHYASHTNNKNENCGGWYNTHVDITNDFHTYGVDIEPAYITYYFDGTPYARCQANSETNKPFYMLINLAVGGAGSWPSEPSSATTWPAYLMVDYVRAYSN